MQITLNQTDIETAIRHYVNDMGISLPVGDITFTAGRGTAGHTAEITVGKPTLASVTTDAPSEEEEEPSADSGKSLFGT